MYFELISSISEEDSAPVPRRAPWRGSDVGSFSMRAALDRGQLTNQAGATVSYRALQQGIRNYYRTYIALPAEARDRPALTPGEGWVCQLCQ